MTQREQDEQAAREYAHPKTTPELIIPEKRIAFLAGIDHECKREKWISVEDKLPEEGQRILVSDGYETLGEAIPKKIQYHDGERMQYVVQKHPCEQDRTITTMWSGITHWQPLPEPPKETT